MKFSFWGKCALIAAALLAIGGVRVQADFITSLTVAQTLEPGGHFRYEYTLSNLTTSDVPAGGFSLDIVADADLRSITGPTGWDISYAPGDTTITWVSSEPSFDLLPGNSALFSFLSPLDSKLRRLVRITCSTTGQFSRT